MIKENESTRIRLEFPKDTVWSRNDEASESNFCFNARIQI